MLVNITRNFTFGGKRYSVGDIPDVDPQIARLFIAEGKAAAGSYESGYPPVGVLARSAVAVPLTGTTSSTVVAQATIPGNSMGPNGGLRITAITSETNNVNTKSLIIRINSTIHYQASLASILGRRVQYEIWNRGATGSQLNFGTSIGTSIGQFTQPWVTTSFDTTQDLPFQIITQLTNSADTITLEAWMIELFYGA